MFGFFRVAAASPQVKVADVEFNKEAIIRLAQAAAQDNVAAVLFPELAITSYTCGDLFTHDFLLDKALEGVLAVAKAAKGLDTVIILGAPLRLGNTLFNCAFVLQHGLVCGVVPKSYLPNYREFYEKRHFESGRGISGSYVDIGDQKAVPFGTDLIFAAQDNFCFGIEICEDLWSVFPPSSAQSVAGSLITFNLSGSNEIAGKARYRRSLVAGQSAATFGAYVYSSCGFGESTSDLVFGGHLMIAENGAVLAENERFKLNESLVSCELDLDRLAALRINEGVMSECVNPEEFRNIQLEKVPEAGELKRRVNPHPFVPAGGDRSANCEEIFNIQSTALASRMRHTKTRKLVLGISGGLDSTLALLVCAQAMKVQGLKSDNITAVTMPGFGTTDRTYNNAKALAAETGATLREISIAEACRQHFAAIGHDENVHDVTYENSQARERTQILMDLANKESALVIGTGDLSELALGWATYNGDHMSMYAVNCSVPKTLIRYIIAHEAEKAPRSLKKVLEDVIATPVSPELLPNDPKQEINQKTEELIGPYEIHDFFLYHFLRYGAEPRKLLFLAEKAFEGKYKHKEIVKNLKIFLQRFFSQQFKRNCIPDGPKVGTVALSPRGDWRMPSDTSARLWLDEIS